MNVIKKMKKQIDSQRKTSGLNDLLSYLMLYDKCTVLHKDGSLSQHFLYEPPDLDSSTQQDLIIHAKTWQHALAFLGDGWMIETNVISNPFTFEKSPQSFPEVLSAIIDDERTLQLQSGNYYRTKCVLSISFKSKTINQAKFSRFIFNQEEMKDPSNKEVSQFKQKVKEFTDYLSKSNNLTYLEASDLVTLFHQCLTGSKDGLVAPYTGAFLDCYLSSEDFIGGFTPQIGNQYIETLAIDDLPNYSYPCILDLLTNFPISYRWSSRFTPLDTSTAQIYLKRYERNWSSKAIGLMGVLRETLNMPAKLNHDAENMAHDIREAITLNSSGQIHYGFYNSTLILIDKNKDRLNETCEEIIKHIQQLNFRVRRERVNATESYLGSLPCHGGYNLRKMLVDTQFVSHVLPMSQVYQGSTQAPCPYYNKAPALLYTATKGNKPFWLNLHVGDVGHTVILGPTGSGKSTLVNALILSHRKYPSSRIIVLDKDNSHKLVIKALSGSYYDLSNSSCQLAPFSEIKPNDKPSQQKAVSWLSDCCTIQGIEVSAELQSHLRDAVERLANEPAEFRNLTHLSVQEPSLRQAIETYTKGGFRHLFNGTQNLWKNSSVLGFAMDGLISTSSQQKDLRLPIIKALFNDLETLFQDRHPTLLCLPEGWAYLKQPLFKDKLIDWFKTLRKYNVAVIFDTQDLADIAQSNTASIIQNACMTRIYLPNAQAQQPAVSDFYRKFGLNEHQIELLQLAQPKKEYYYTSPQGNRLFSLDLGDIEKSFLCLASKEDIEKFEKIYDPNNPKWILSWLKALELNDWYNFIASNYFQGQAK